MGAKIASIGIYGILDPETGELRYIGKTRNSLTKRLGNHICKAQQEVDRSGIAKEFWKRPEYRQRQQIALPVANP